MSKHSRKSFISQQSSCSESGDDGDSSVDLSVDLTANSTPHNKEESQTDSSTDQGTAAVRWTKVLVITALFLAAIGVGALTYYYASQSEHHQFETQFGDYAIQISDMVHEEAELIFLAVESFSATLTSYVLDSQHPWPYAALPHFEVQGKHLIKLSKALLVGIAPLVTNETRAQWEIFASYMQGWVHVEVDEAELDHELELHEELYHETEEHEEQNHEFVGHQAHQEFITREVFWTDDLEHNKKITTKYPANGTGPFLPVWQTYPTPHDPVAINYDLFNDEMVARLYRGMVGHMEHVLSENTNLEFLYGPSVEHDSSRPFSLMLHPVFRDFSDVGYNESDIVATIFAVLPWSHYFAGIMPDKARNLIVVMTNTCGDVFTYEINGKVPVYLGLGDMHDIAYDYLEVTTPFDLSHTLNVSLAREHCEYNLHIYPSSKLEQEYKTSSPMTYAVLVVMVFVVTTTFFILYDCLVERRQQKILATARKTKAVVSSLFPKNVRDRIMKEAEQMVEAEEQAKKSGVPLAPSQKSKLRSFLYDENKNQIQDESQGLASKPIADLFPSCTVMYGDIAGFTAWSSVREPTQVFQLLENVYHVLDEIAKRRRVFKVETVGDCYVAVCGLPEPRKDHATVMARFARDCIAAFNELTKKLEVVLGPDTGDLAMRIGIHSGPVTAGVLRGDNCRFQLFGDTVNMAARIEATGSANRVHVSSSTAELIKKSGKDHWIRQRRDKVFVVGKGEVTTFWLDLKKKSHETKSSNSDSEEKLHLNLGASEMLCTKYGDEVLAATKKEMSPKIKRLVQWNAECLIRLLCMIVARREASEAEPRSGPIEAPKATGNCFSEVVEIITLPKFDAKAAAKQCDPLEVKLPTAVIKQVYHFVTTIASLYRSDTEVKFHNFEHASHVTMSVVKLLSRIVAPDIDLDADDEAKEIEKQLHDHTYGITSDPLTQFAVVFSAIIHDADHLGLPNAELVKEELPLATAYNNQSVAEQNSLDIAWDLLMGPSFKELRETIYASEVEARRFRQLLVNVVMATDICDKDLKALRNARWEKAFQEVDSSTLDAREVQDNKNRKATIVLEHLIQASDIAHTMQHWHIYLNWNKRFFKENVVAFEAGRAEKDPRTYWYKGEIGFFDFYIIPLAKKLKECGVFGVSCDEYLNYALNNRAEWERCGQACLDDMAAEWEAEKLGQLNDPNGDFSTTHDPSTASVADELPTKVEIVDKAESTTTKDESSSG